MDKSTIAIVHPGEMGAALGSAARELGHLVVWSSQDRSPQTRARALRSGLVELESMAALVAASSVVISICPPHAAIEVAAQVAAAGFSGTYLEANAISPDRARQVGSLLREVGATFVDGAVIGSPPAPGSDTTLWLSGPSSAEIAALFAGSDRLRTRVLAEPPEGASSLKMCYAAWSKGTSALLLAIRAASAALGVEEALLDEWQSSQPELRRRLAQAEASAPRKGWRFADEMDQIADTLAGAGVPSDFHRGAAEVYRRLAQFKDDASGPSEEQILSAVRTPGGRLDS